MALGVHHWRVESSTADGLLCWLIFGGGVEGAFTVLASAVLFFVISDFPEEVKWLNKEEKEFVQGRLYEDVGSSGRHDPLTPTVVLEVLKDCKSACHVCA